jgi:hypothetical protein
MAEERIGPAASESHRYWAWTELFRTFQVALDPKKLILAAAGIVVMWIGWWLLSIIFFSARSEPRDADFQAVNYQTEGMTEDQAKQRAAEKFLAAQRGYRLLYSLAGPGDPNATEEWRRRTGLFRTAPWHEDRGPNPFLLATGQLGRPWSVGHFFDWLFTDQVPVLIEPLVKLLRPILLLLRPEADGWNRIYLLLVTLWTLLTWALFGGAITRLAAVQLAGKDRPSLMEAVRFVAARYVSYLSAPLVPLACIALIVILGVIFGLIHLIPVVGDVADSVAWPFLILLGFGQAVLLIGMVGYPLMYATISAEGSDTFDAISRSYNYVLQSPWSYIWYSFVAVAYGCVLVFFVGFVGSMVVYLAKWSVAQNAATEYFVSRRVDNLFVFAPTSFGWRDLLVSVPALESGAGPAEMTAYMKNNFYAWNYFSAFFVSMWIILIFLLVIGFAYSYYFTAFTQIYFLMRRQVDDTDMEEVYLEEDEPSEPLLPPKPATPPASPPGGASLPVVEAPSSPPPDAGGAPNPGA